jgi:hypothetical protein
MRLWLRPLLGRAQDGRQSDIVVVAHRSGGSLIDRKWLEQTQKFSPL